MQQQALSATVAWVRLDRAMELFHAELKQRFGITGLQFSVLRILSERPQLPLAALRKALVMHPATLGQAIDGLRTRGLCTVRRNPEDKRARDIALTPEGAELITRVPLAGAMRLREINHDPARLDRLRDALEDAIDLFGLAPWVEDRREASGG